MSTPSPLLPPDALEGAAAPKSRIRITVLTILALHVVFIGGLLLQGCEKNGTRTTSAEPTNTVTGVPSLADNPDYFSSYPGDTSPPPDSLANSSSTSTSTSTTPSGSYGTSYNTGTSTGAGTGTVDRYPLSDSSTSSQSSYATTPDPVISNPAPSYTSRATLPPAMTGTSSRAMTEHAIEKGDTLGALAKRYGVTEQAIREANPNVKPRALKIGDTLNIPPPAPARVDPIEATAPAGSQFYTVQRGDTLSGIAKRHGVTINQIRSANEIRGDRILPKQRLVIPPKAGSSETSNPPRF